jgi:hypothetical protein
MSQTDNIKERVFALLANIADVEFQRTAWFGKGQFRSSPDEMLCQYYDDLEVPEFIRENSHAMSCGQRIAFESLDAELLRFAESSDDFLDPVAVLSDETWMRIRILAADVVRSFGQDVG